MTIKYERVYFQHRNVEVPPDTIRLSAESQSQYLHPERTHILTCGRAGHLSRAPLASSEGWIVTYSPDAP